MFKSVTGVIGFICGRHSIVGNNNTIIVDEEPNVSPQLDAAVTCDATPDRSNVKAVD